MKQHQVRPALCLDLDWTVRRPISDGKFIKDKNDITLMPNVEEKIWEYKDKGYLIIGITNQGGVAHGFKTPIDIDEELDVMCNLFNKNPFDEIFTNYSMLGGSKPFHKRSLCRKPSIGMLVRAEIIANNKHGIIIDWDNSLMVGDMRSDSDLATNANIAFKWAKYFFAWDSIENSIELKDTP